MGLRAFEPILYVDAVSDSESEPDIYVLPIIRKMRELQLKEPDKKKRECQAKVKRALSAVKAATGFHLINPDTSNPIDVGMVFEGNIYVESVLGFELDGACLCLKGKQNCEILVKEEPQEPDCLWSDHASKEYLLQVRHANGKVTNVPGSTLTLHPYCAFVVRFRRWLDGLRIYVNDVLVAQCDGQFACESSLQLVVNGGWDVKSVHIPAATLVNES
ncbi:hypothetical protein HPB47_012164 [Ixodes persulcatus]|uniref:Uncharacterized protein n=1 Tax=Ixodes persulcatus TaxID=34615 RepID=A0AC60NUF3_IXOPE|nr:hypothetical protein HPB47_012164 [Ixodes persulcatus]